MAVKAEGVVVWPKAVASLGADSTHVWVMLAATVAKEAVAVGARPLELGTSGAWANWVGSNWD